MPRTVVLVPTYDHVETLRPAVNSAVNQTDRDLEVHIIGDGAPPATQQVADELCSRHRQVHFHAHPKSPRTGEPYRDALLRRVDAQFALYLSDDDVWAPDHCSVLTSALKDHDLASTLSTYVRPGETSIHLSRLQFADPADCELELHHQSRVSLTETGHRVDSYLQLPYGWRTTPTGEHTDHWMWKQWLAQDWVRATTVEQITQIHFADFMRKEMPVGERVSEQEGWWERMSSPTWSTERTELLIAALFEGFGHVDRSLLHHQRQVETLGKLLTETQAAKRTETNQLRTETNQLRTEIDRLTDQLTESTAELQTMSHSRTWRYGQRAASLVGYRALRNLRR